MIAERLLITTGLDDLTARQPRKARPRSAGCPTPTTAASSSSTSHPPPRAIVDELLPSLHARERDVMSAALTTSEQRELLRLIAKLQHAALARAIDASPTRRRPSTREPPQADPRTTKGIATMTATVPRDNRSHHTRWRGINHLALITTDMDATVRFYHGDARSPTRRHHRHTRVPPLLLRVRPALHRRVLRIRRRDHRTLHQAGRRARPARRAVRPPRTQPSRRRRAPRPATTA